MVNPNIATIQTDTRFADKVYLLPVTQWYIESIIEKERPDGIMLGFGGQTSLNCGIQLSNNDILKKYDIDVLGTPTSGINVCEDRQLFKNAMNECNIPVLESNTITTFNKAKKVADTIGYPVIIRVAYTLGGKGGGVAYNEIELYEIVNRGLNISMVKQVMIEKYVGSWKQIEYEIMRDHHNNIITICNMENILSMKVHTGDNIVVAPSQTIDNHEYHLLRSAALHAAKHIGIIGECNVQFALDTKSRYAVIEINPRLSRSSALASKATGYPIAYISTKINLGYQLSELINDITKKTTACFEPSLDYVICKHPRWDFNKFESANRKLGTTMKSTGEVMAIGKTFEESLQKAIRMLDIENNGLVLNEFDMQINDEEYLENRLLNPDNMILYYVAIALKKGMSIEKIHRLSFIDPWFIKKIKNIVDIEKKLKKFKLRSKLLREAKIYGFSDKQIGKATSLSNDKVRTLRKNFNILPVVKQIDTLSAECPAKTNYLYMTYNGNKNDFEISKKYGIVVLGAGPYKIGSSVEFDWGTVNMVLGLQENGEKNIVVINCNPETVSTDYDICERLYFEELTAERIIDIIEFENSKGIITSVGGQIANSLTPILAKNGINIIGTTSSDIDRAEDRSKFSKILDELNIKQPQWQVFSDLQKAEKFSKSVGYPVIVRPSYVLSGASMKVVWSRNELKKHINETAILSLQHPVVISKFMLDSLEADVDGVSDTEHVIIGSIIEHIDNAGIHSGDAMMCIPPRRLDRNTLKTIIEYTNSIALSFNIRGLFNIQFIINNGNVYVIELNIRASRSMPFVSKLAEINLIKLAANAILGKSIPHITYNKYKRKFRYGVKVPQFSFMQLDGADIKLGVEMQSTGEAACFGDSFYDALSKGLISVGYTLPKKGNVLVTIGGNENKRKLLQTIEILQNLDFQILATEHTAKFLLKNLPNIKTVYKISEHSKKPNIIDLLYDKKIDFIINIPNTISLRKYSKSVDEEYRIRRKALELGIPVLTTIELAESFIKTLEWLQKNKPTIESLEPYKL